MVGVVRYRVQGNFEVYVFLHKIWSVLYVRTYLSYLLLTITSECKALWGDPAEVPSFTIVAHVHALHGIQTA